MTKKLMFGIVAIGISILFSSLSNNALAINEDQIEACNWEGECVTIDIDDFMNDKKRDHLWSIFNNDIDTYDIKDMTVTPLK